MSAAMLSEIRCAASWACHAQGGADGVGIGHKPVFVHRPIAGNTVEAAIQC